MSTLISHDEPSGAHDVLVQALQRVYQRGPSASSLRQLHVNQSQLAAHHPLLDVALADLAAGYGFDRAVRTGSRYLVYQQNGELSAAAEIASDPQGLIAGNFQSLNQGPFVVGTENAILIAEADGGHEEVCHFSMLRCAQMPLMVVRVIPYLAPNTPRCYVVAPAPAPLESDRSYSEAELKQLLQPLAQALMHLAAGDGNSAGTLSG